MKSLYLTLLFAIFATAAWCEDSVHIALYDVGELYDTSPSTFYDDSEYTPQGRKRWNEAKYQRKVKNISAVIDSMSMPIVILRGVENESVVRDIVRTCNGDYSYTHRSLDYYTGLDFALLYYGDMLFVDKVRSNNYWLYVGGEILGSTISIHLSLRGDKLHTTLPPESDTASDITLSWGNFSRRDLKRLHLHDPLRERERKGQGDTKSKIGWYFKNRIGVSSSEGDCGVYINEWLLHEDSNAPLSTFSENGYRGGYSSHLPQYISIITK